MSDRRDHVLAPPDLVLKRASKAAIRAFGGTEAAAEQLVQAPHRRVVTHRNMSDAGNPNHGDFLRIDEAAEIEELTVGAPGWPHITRSLAARTGHMLVPVPRPQSPLQTAGAAWGLMASQLARQAGEMGGGLCADLSDDHDISPAEAESRLACAAELVRVTVELEYALKMRAGAGK